MIMMTSSNGNICRVTGPLCGKSPVIWYPTVLLMTSCLWIRIYIDDCIVQFYNRLHSHTSYLVSLYAWHFLYWLLWRIMDPEYILTMITKMSMLIRIIHDLKMFVEQTRLDHNVNTDANLNYFVCGWRFSMHGLLPYVSIINLTSIYHQKTITLAVNTLTITYITDDHGACWYLHNRIS